MILWFYCALACLYVPAVCMLYFSIFLHHSMLGGWVISSIWQRSGFFFSLISRLKTCWFSTQVLKRRTSPASSSVPEGRREQLSSSVLALKTFGRSLKDTAKNMRECCLPLHQGEPRHRVCQRLEKTCQCKKLESWLFSRYMRREKGGFSGLALV